MSCLCSYYVECVSDGGFGYSSLIYASLCALHMYIKRDVDYYENTSIYCLLLPVIFYSAVTYAFQK